MTARNNSPLPGFTRITFDPEVMGGRACVRGLRIPVSLVVKLVASDTSTAEILQDYPDLEGEDVSECLNYAAWLASEETLPAGEALG